jgi:YidC/Oxa1 family membrane protein insertase
VSQPRLQPSGQSGDQQNVITAILLMALITLVWMWFVSPPPGGEVTAQEDPIQDTSEVADRPGLPRSDTATTAQARKKDTAAQAAPAAPTDTSERIDKEAPALPPDDPALAGARDGEARSITVETKHYRAVFSTKGATLTSFVLKDYTQFDQETPVRIMDSAGTGATGLAFTTPQNHNIDTRSLYFTPNAQGDSFTVRGEKRALTFTAKLGGGKLLKTYVFKPDQYELDLQVSFEKPGAFMTRDGYELTWKGGIPYTEGDPETEARKAGAYARHGGEVVGLKLTSNDTGEQSMSGQVGWTGVKTKYFTAVMMPQGETRGATLEGEKKDQPAFWENYQTYLRMPPPTAGQTDTYRMYLGPMEYYNITAYDKDLYGMVDYGWDFFEIVTRTLAQVFFIPFFNFLSRFISNYGIVIILLAITVKTLVYPLTKKAYTSMAKMRELQPKMEEIREEYGDDPQQQQQEMMKLYKETGVNPLGGCMPMLLQYPFLIALWQFLPNSIEIRQESFLWAHDLSAPDPILQLPFEIPFYGDYVAGFTLLMGMAMIVQMRVQSSGSSNPQAKIFQYVMPFVLFFIFNGFAAGLSLYYLIYNIFNAVQQKIINNQIEAQKEEGDGSLTSSNGRSGNKDDDSKSFWDRVMEQAEA